MSDFIDRIKDGAIATWQTHRILPSITLAQAILESGWGTSELAIKANNLFGIKAGDGWSGDVHTAPTQEWDGSKMATINAAFRSYTSWADSVIDHGAFFTSTPWRTNNYRAVVGETDYRRAAQALQSAGYATDPGYASKLIALIEAQGLAQYDKGGNAVGKHLIIAGHGKNKNGTYDPGATGQGITEAGVIRDTLIPAIQKYDGGQIDYVTDHNVYSYQSIGQYKAYDTVTEIHFNAFNGQAFGTEVLIKQGYRADKIDNALLSHLARFFRNRGIKPRSDLQNVNMAAAAGINYRLIEVCFVDNPSDMDIFFTNVDAIAKGIAEAITGKQSQAPQEPKGSDPNMRPEVVKYFEDLYDTIHNPEPAEWGAEAWEKATDLNVVDGNRPNALLTRLEYAASELRRLKG